MSASILPFGRSLALAVALAGALAVSSACISPSVVSPEQRALDLEDPELDWVAASPEDLPGTYVSTTLRGSLASSLRKLVYLFSPDGAYTGAALLDDAPPRFVVLTGTWRMDEGALVLDAAPPASVEVAGDGSLRLTGAEGQVVLRRERQR